MKTIQHSDSLVMFWSFFKHCLNSLNFWKNRKTVSLKIRRFLNKRYGAKRDLLNYPSIRKNVYKIIIPFKNLIYILYDKKVIQARIKKHTN